MDKLSMTTLLNSIQAKFVLPAIKNRKQFLLNYLKSMTEENSKYLTFILQESNGNQSFINTSDDACYLTDEVKTICLFDLPESFLNFLSWVSSKFFKSKNLVLGSLILLILLI